MQLGVTFRYKLENIISIQKILTVDYRQLTEDYCFAGESHDFWELFYVDTGIISINLDGNDIQLKEGELILFPPNHSHAISSKKSNNPSYFLITFDSTSPALSIFYDAKFRLAPENKKVLSKLLDEVSNTFTFNATKKRLELIENPSTGGQQLIHSYLEILLISIIRHEEQSKKTQKIYLSKEDINNQTVKEIVLLLEDSIYGELKLEDISNQLNFGKTYLSTLFKSVMHCSIMQYYNALKLAEAKKLLKSTFFPISEIADKLCYESPSYFCKFFKKNCGMSPKQYRQSISNK